ncbi:MAG TPA: VOC family protein [Solirubrobacteraceae bacterium]|jgi:catechol 2,3-dioxygenase-like lactoylglutathione lyase family enzyme
MVSGDGGGQLAGGESRSQTGRVVGFFHASVTVSDMDEALRFYRDGLGLELRLLGTARGPEANRIWGLAPTRVKVAFLDVPGGDAQIELFEFEGIDRNDASARPCDYGAGHFCLYVDDADAVHGRLRELGFGARSEMPVEIQDGPFAGAKAIYTIDPDGYHVELYQHPGRASA